MTAPRPLTRLAAVKGGLRAAIGTPGLVLMASFVGFGGLAHDAGWPLGVTVLSTVLVWALPGQVVLMGALAAGASPVAAVVAVGLSAVRLLPMVVSMMPVLRAPGMGLPMQFWCAHFIAQTIWVESFRRLPDIDRDLRPAYFLGIAHGLLAMATSATVAGYMLAGKLAEPLAVGLLFLTPIFFILSLEAGARLFEEKVAVWLGLVLCPVMVAYAPEPDLLWTGLVGGTLAFLAGLARERMT